MAIHESGTQDLLIFAAFATLAVYGVHAVYSVIYNIYLHPLAKFPGPPLARVSIYWKAYIECITSQSFCHYLVELHRHYGQNYACPCRPTMLTCMHCRRCCSCGSERGSIIPDAISSQKIWLSADDEHTAALR